MPTDIDDWEDRPPPLPPERMILGAVALLDDVGPIRRSRRQLTDTALLLFLPVGVLFALVVVPVVRTIWQGMSNDPWATPGIGPAMARTILWTIVVPLGVTAAGLFLADILGRTAPRDRARGLSGRVMFLLIAPLAVPLVVTGIAFRLLFHPDPHRGLATRFLWFIPGDQGWLGPRSITWSLVIAFVWATLGLATVVFRTALDRMRDIIVQGKEHIYPVEIEDALRSRGDVEACALAVPEQRDRITRASILTRQPDLGDTGSSDKKDTEQVEQELRSYLHQLGGRFSTFLPGTIEIVEELPSLESPRGAPHSGWNGLKRYRYAGLGWVAVTVFLLIAVMTSRTLDLILTVAPGSSLDDASVLSVLHWQAREATPGQQEALSTLWLSVLLMLVFVCLLLLRITSWQRPRWPHLRLGQSRSRRGEASRHPENNIFRRLLHALRHRASLPRAWVRKFHEPSHVGRSALYLALAVAWLFPLLALLMTSWHDHTEAASRAWWSKPSWLAFGSWSFDDVTLAAMLRTAGVALVAVVIVVVLASLVAKAVEGMSSLGGQAVVVGVIGLALIPPQVVGAQVNEVFAWGPLDGWQRLTLVHVALAVPLAVIVLHNTGADWLGGMWTELQERLAEISEKRTNGVGRNWRKAWAVVSTPWKTAWKEQPTVVAVAVLVFLQVWNDFVIGLMVGQDAIPLTVHMFGQTRHFVSNSGPLAAASAIAAIVPLTLLGFTGPKLIEGFVGKEVKR